MRMEIVRSNSESGDKLRRLNILKRKRTTIYKSKSSSNNKAISLRKSKSSNITKAAASGGSLLEAPPRAMGIDGHFYECMKCNEVGSLICCDTCACTYHHECVDPPLVGLPEGDWFCHNCSKEADGNLSDSTLNVTGKRRRRSKNRACKASSGCCLCSNIKKKIIPDENDFFSFKSKSRSNSIAPQSNLSDRGQPSARKDGRNSAIVTHNTNNNGDKRLVLRPRNRAAEGKNYQNQTRETAKRASSSSAQAAGKDQNVNNQPPRRRGRPRKYPQQNEQQQQQQGQRQQEQERRQSQKPGRAMVVYGANLPQEYLEAMRAAEEARRNNAKEIPWSGVELDALWVGVRRHGVDKWETILGDPNLCILVLCKKTISDMSLRWQKELQQMSSILQASGFLHSPPPPDEQPEDDRPEQPVIGNGEAATTAQQQLFPPPLTSTESGPLFPNHQGSSSSSASVPAEAGGELRAEPSPPPLISDKEATPQQVLPPQQIPVNNHPGSSSSSSSIQAVAESTKEAGGEGIESTEIPVNNASPDCGAFGSPLNPVATLESDGESGEPKEANIEQHLLPPEMPAGPPLSGALVVAPNDRQGTSYGSLKDSPSVPKASDIGAMVPVAAGGEGNIEVNTQQHFGVTSPQSGGALVVARSYYQQGPSSSSMVSRACVSTVAVTHPPWRPNLSLQPPQWRPNLNLHPMDNHLMFEAFQRRRANPRSPTIMNHMTALPAGRGVAMAARRPPANSSTVRPDLFLGGYFPVRNSY